MTREKTQTIERRESEPLLVGPRADVPVQQPQQQQHPMQPQQQPQRSLWWVWLLIVLAVAGVGLFYYKYYYAPQGDGKPTTMPVRDTPVVASVAKKGDMKIYLTGLGSAQALNTVTLHTRVDGELDLVKFTEGQIVKKGDLLAEIDPRPFQVQLAQAIGQRAHDQALLDNANVDLKRYNEAGDSVSKQERATQEALVQQYTAALAADQAVVDQANLNLIYCHIIAPIPGKIGLRLVDQGNIVHANDPSGLAVITQLQPIAVVFTLPEDDLAKVLERVNNGEPLKVVAFDRDMRKRLSTGMLVAIDNQIDLTSGTIRLKASFPNEDSSLYPNQFVNARLLVQTVKDTILIPAAAIQRTTKMNYVYVVKLSGKVDKDKKPQGAVIMKPIAIGPIEGDQASITSGLEDGDVVVTDGVDKLMPDSKVVVTYAPVVDDTKQGKNSTTKSATTESTTMPSTFPKAK